MYDKIYILSYLSLSSSPFFVGKFIFSFFSPDNSDALLVTLGYQKEELLTVVPDRHSCHGPRGL
jgi:hypothetical protein